MIGDRSRNAARALLWMIVAAVSAAFAVNAWFSFTDSGVALRSGGRWYSLLFYLPFGVLVPAYLMARMVAGQSTGIITPAIGPKALTGALVALLAGAAIAAFPLASVAADAEGVHRLHRLFALLLIASFAEVMIFLGLVGNTVMAGLCARGHGPLAAGTAAGAASCILFGLFHLTYPPPWNTLESALLLAGIWVGVALVFFLTRSLLGAVLFNNTMALVGFVQGRLDLPGSALEGWARAVVAVLLAIALLEWVRRRAERLTAARAP